MNINKTEAYDHGVDADQEVAKKEALIQEAVENSEDFLFFLLGWMKNQHLDDLAKAAESWLKTYKEE